MTKKTTENHNGETPPDFSYDRMVYFNTINDSNNDNSEEEVIAKAHLAVLRGLKNKYCEHELERG